MAAASIGLTHKEEGGWPARPARELRLKMQRFRARRGQTAIAGRRPQAPSSHRVEPNGGR